MATESSGEDSVLADCASPFVDSSRGGGRRRQVSVMEMMRRVSKRNAKRTLPGRSSRSPPDPAPPTPKRRASAAAGRSDGGGRQPAGASGPGAAVELTAGALEAIQHLVQRSVDASSSRVLTVLSAKIDSLQQRISVLEGECMDKDAIIDRLSDQLERQDRVLEDLQERIEGIDANRRLSSIILTCEDFSVVTPNEDIEEKAIQVIKKRLPDLNIVAGDIQAAHRLQGNSKVIVRFVKRRLRDELYDSRFQLFSNAAGQRQRNVAPLYITESLTPSNRLIYTALLDARRPENGGKVASVFTRRGQVYCRLEKGGANIRVPTWERLEDILGGAGRSTRPAGRPGRRGAPPGGRAPLLPSVSPRTSAAPAAPADMTAPSAPAAPAAPGAPGTQVAPAAAAALRRTGPPRGVVIEPSVSRPPALGRPSRSTATVVLPPAGRPPGPEQRPACAAPSSEGEPEQLPEQRDAEAPPAATPNRERGASPDPSSAA